MSSESFSGHGQWPGLRHVEMGKQKIKCGAITHYQVKEVSMMQTDNVQVVYKPMKAWNFRPTKISTRVPLLDIIQVRW
jgi:hypothetical protein